MAQLPSTRYRIFSEETQFRAAVSESMAQKMGSQLNFVTNRQHDEMRFKLNGPYGDVAVVPQLNLDGIYVFPWDAEIWQIAMTNATPGSSGTTEIDVKRATVSGGAFTSIFSTTPKIASTAAANSFLLSYTVTDSSTSQTWVTNATPPTGCTPGVFAGGAPYLVNAGDAIKVDLLAIMLAAAGASLTIFHRPR